MLGLWFSFRAIHIVQTKNVQTFAGDLQILPEVENDKQVNEEGTTLTLDCIDQDVYATLQSTDEMKWILSWKLPRSQVT
jgi:hypothetical protein